MTEILSSRVDITQFLIYWNMKPRSLIKWADQIAGQGREMRRSYWRHFLWQIKKWYSNCFKRETLKCSASTFLGSDLVNTTLYNF